MISSSCSYPQQGPAERGESSRAMVRTGCRSATIAVIETTNEDLGGGMAASASGDTTSLQLAPCGVSVRGSRPASSAADDEGDDEGLELIDQAQAAASDDEEEAVGITARQKSMLGFIWYINRVCIWFIILFIYLSM